MKSMFSRLYSYRERPGSSRLVDFLTEAVADLFNRLPVQDRLAMLAVLLKPSPTAKSMADSEVVPGFVALQDDASSASFAKVRKRARVMHSRAEVDSAIDEAIATRLAAKDDAKFEGDILLITAPLGSSPNRSATALQTVHGARAEALPFAEVHVLDGSRRSPIVRLK